MLFDFVCGACVWGFCLFVKVKNISAATVVVSSNVSFRRLFCKRLLTYSLSLCALPRSAWSAFFIFSKCLLKKQNISKVKFSLLCKDSLPRISLQLNSLSPDLVNVILIFCLSKVWLINELCWAYFFIMIIWKLNNLWNSFTCSGCRKTGGTCFREK